MHIRRLRLDDDEDEQEQYYEVPQVQPPNPTNVPPETLEISDDDDFIDVSDNLSPPSPPPPPPPLPQDTGCPISDSLRRLGVGLKREWVSACLRELEGSVSGFAGFDVATKTKLCFEQFLFADMNSCGSGVLPANVDSMHPVNLPGPYVLQVDEILNISCPLRSRYQKAPPGLKRCLKLSMTDGIQRVFGMEYRPIQALEVCASSGLKVAISNVHVRHGLLMLVPETIDILGGIVERLDAARKRLVDELNKPPRGKRTKNGVLPPLATRATLAAWPSSQVDHLGHSSSTLQSANSFQENNQGIGLSMPGTGNSLTIDDTLLMGAQNGASSSLPHTVPDAGAMNMDVQADTGPVSFASSTANPFSSTVVTTKEMHIDTTNIQQQQQQQPPQKQKQSLFPISEVGYIDTTNITRENSVSNQSSHMRSNVAVAHDDTVQITRESSVATTCSTTAENDNTDRDRILRGSFSTVSNTDDINMVDADDLPSILVVDQEVPFTYLASLSAKWDTMKEKAPSVQGKIKCLLTGVKGFQYKRRTTYELVAYVDDGSRISEVLIDHNVVQKGIGYSPEEVTAALSSSDMKIAHNMKDSMRKYQAFLANFEGVILVEFNRKSSLPLALEMSQGCDQSEAWLLLRRLKCPQPMQVQKHFPSDLIDLSP